MNLVILIAPLFTHIKNRILANLYRIVIRYFNTFNIFIVIYFFLYIIATIISKSIPYINVIISLLIINNKAIFYKRALILTDIEVTFNSFSLYSLSLFLSYFSSN